MSTTPPEILTPLTAFLFALGYMAIRVLDRMTKAKASRSETTDAIGQGQMDLTLSLARSRDDRQERLDRLQDIMIKEQQNNRETMRRLTDEITNAVLMISKALSQQEALAIRQSDWAIRMMDWDTRLGLFMEHQKLQDTVQSQMFAHIKTIISILNSLVSLLTPKEKDTSS